MSRRTEDKDLRDVQEALKFMEDDLPRRRWIVCWTEDPEVPDKHLEVHERLLKRYKIDVERSDISGRKDHKAFVDHSVFFDEEDCKKAVTLYRKVVKSKSTWCASMALCVLDTEC